MWKITGKDLDVCAPSKKVIIWVRHSISYKTAYVLNEDVGELHIRAVWSESIVSA